MAGQTTIKLEGDKQLIDTLRRHRRSVATTVMRKAVNAGAQVILKAARKDIPIGPGLDTRGRKRKHLRQSMKKRIRRYQGGMFWVGVIGPEAKITPHKHLVHDGTKPHWIDVRRKERKGQRMLVFHKFLKIGGRFITPPVRHPGARANPFLTRAERTQKTAAINAVNAKLREAINALGSK